MSLELASTKAINYFVQGERKCKTSVNICCDVMIFSYTININYSFA